MFGGFAIHALDTFGQSNPKPDLSELPPESVFEIGELWSCSRARVVRFPDPLAAALGIRAAMRRTQGEARVPGTDTAMKRLPARSRG